MARGNIWSCTCAAVWAFVLTNFGCPAHLECALPFISGSSQPSDSKQNPCMHLQGRGTRKPVQEFLAPVWP